MAEKKYIDHKKFNSKLNYIIRAYGLTGVISEKIKKAIKESEAADVVEVVRCKDCKHYHNTQCFHPSYGDDCAINTERAENDFCSYGERKDG